MAEHTSAPGSSVGYFTLVRENRNFRLLWLGQIVSLFGDWFNLIASAALVSQLTESGLAVGGLFVLRMLAPFLISPFAGVAADRYNRKRLLILADLSRAAVVLGFLLVRDPGQVWLLYVLTFIQLGYQRYLFPNPQRHPARYRLAARVRTSQCLEFSNLVGDAGVGGGSGRHCGR